MKDKPPIMGAFFRETIIDNASTPEDIAETNELESLRSMREAVQCILIDCGPTIHADHYTLSKAINNIGKVVNPDEL